MKVENLSKIDIFITICCNYMIYNDSNCACTGVRSIYKEGFLQMKRKKEHRKSLGARLVSLMLAADLPAEEGVSWKFGMDPDAAAGYEFLT